MMMKKNKIRRKTIFNMADGILTPCNVACGSGIVTVNSPSGSTVLCDTWLWDDMPLNSPKLNVCHIGILHLVSISTTCTAVDIIIAPVSENRTTLGRKKLTSCRFSRWWISAILDFRDPIMGSLKSPITVHNFEIETIALTCLVFEKIAFFAFWRQTDKHRQTDRRTDGHHRCRSRCRERLDKEVKVA